VLYSFKNSFIASSINNKKKKKKKKKKKRQKSASSGKYLPKELIALGSPELKLTRRRLINPPG